MGRLSIYITNLGKYAEGYLIGQWLLLPCPEDKLQEALTAIGINDEYEEYFITDSESEIPNIHIDQYASLSELNKLAAKIEELADYDYDKLTAVLEWESALTVTGIIDIIDNLDSYDLLSDISDDAALGEYFATELGVFDAIPVNLRYYLDTERYGRDLRLELDMCYTSYGAVMRN